MAPSAFPLINSPICFPFLLFFILHLSQTFSTQLNCKQTSCSFDCSRYGCQNKNALTSPHIVNCSSTVDACFIKCSQKNTCTDFMEVHSNAQITTIECSGESSCRNLSVFCTSKNRIGKSCSLKCLGSESCYKSRLKCDGIFSEGCKVEAVGKYSFIKSNMSCNIQPDESCELNCSEDKYAGACYKSNVFCPNNHNCIRRGYERESDKDVERRQKTHWKNLRDMQEKQTRLTIGLLAVFVALALLALACLCVYAKLQSKMETTQLQLHALHRVDFQCETTTDDEMIIGRPKALKLSDQQSEKILKDILDSELDKTDIGV